MGGFTAGDPQRCPERDINYYARSDSEPATGFEEPAAAAGPQHKPEGLMVEMTLEQACPPEYWRAQCAFKDSMIH